MTGKLDLETRLVAALTDTARRNLPEGTAVPPLRRPVAFSDSRSRPAGLIRAWTVPALVAVVVVALAVGVVVLTHRGQDRGPQAATGGRSGTFVTLRARSAGLGAADLARARQIISARAAGLGAVKADVRVVGANEITAFLPGVTAANVAGLGAVDALEFRPLIVDPISSSAPKASSTPAPGTAARVVDPWKSLGFTPPKDAAAYNALGATRRGAVRAVLTGWNCGNSSLDRADAPIVACDLGRTEKYLLGPAIVTSNEISAGRPIAPDLSQRQWTVVVSFGTAGQRRWTDYTAKHNESEHSGELANVVAFTLDGEVLVASTIQSTINGDTSLVGNFDQQGATSLAANLTAGGTLPVPFDVVSIRSR
jgi:preprotein translocase subunit SecD